METRIWNSNNYIYFYKHDISYSENLDCLILNKDELYFSNICSNGLQEQKFKIEYDGDTTDYINFNNKYIKKICKHNNNHYCIVTHVCAMTGTKNNVVYLFDLDELNEFINGKKIYLSNNNQNFQTIIMEENFGIKNIKNRIQEITWKYFEAGNKNEHNVQPNKMTKNYLCLMEKNKLCLREHSVETKIIIYHLDRIFASKNYNFYDYFGNKYENCLIQEININHLAFYIDNHVFIFNLNNQFVILETFDPIMPSYVHAINNHQFVALFCSELNEYMSYKIISKTMEIKFYEDMAFNFA